MLPITGMLTHQTKLEGSQTIVELLILTQATFTKRRIARLIDAIPAPSRHHRILTLKLTEPVIQNILLYLIDHRHIPPARNVDVYDMTGICVERHAKIHSNKHNNENTRNCAYYPRFKQNKHPPYLNKQPAR